MKKLLIIEDISAEAEILTRLYQMVRARFHGAVEITIAPKWAEGVLVVETVAPDVVLLDLGLPDSTTELTVERIKQVSPSWPPIVVLTGHDEREKELRPKCIKDGGASDFMLKKIAHRDPEQLCERIYHAYLRGEYARGK